MADYPLPPSFEAASGRRSQPMSFQGAIRNGTYEYEDLQQEDRRLYDHDKAQSLSAFQYNRYVSGFSASPLTTGIAPFPTCQAREPSSYQFPVIAPAQNGRHVSTRLSGSPHSKTYQENPLAHEPSPNMPPAREYISPSHAATAQLIEEGELSEGEYEAGIESEPNIVPVEITRKDQYKQRDGHRASAHRALHMRSLDHEVELTDELVDEYGRSVALNGRRSNSYSPYGSPNQLEYNAHRGPKRARYELRATLNEQSESAHKSKHMPGKVLESTRAENPESSGSDLNTEKKNSILIQSASLQTQNNSNASGVVLHNLMLQSVRDARKEAQNAILNLWPFKVRLQNYIDEGIDEEVVRRQFEELGMLQVPLTDKQRTDHLDRVTRDTSSQRELPVDAVNITSSSISKSDNDQAQRSPHHPRSVSPINAKNIPSKSENNGLGGQNQAARSLTKNSLKLTSPIMKESEPSISLSPEASTSKKAVPNSQSIAKADKERLLQQKMEALQKSREQRAQKAAAKNSTPAHTTPTLVSSTSAIQSLKETIAAISQPISQTAAESGKPISPPYNISTPKLPTLSIPGLFLAASASATQAAAISKDVPGPTPSNNQRKRPVASDFDRASSSTDSYKRPFGQSRNEQRLVIDVSEDESDDGQSSEIEVDSKSDDKPAHHPTSGPNSAKPTAIRDLPPLSDFPQRKQFQMPRSALNTPPVQQSVNKPTISNPEDLLRKEMEIQELKRRIAEAETKKKARMNLSGSQTPRSNESTGSPAKSTSGATIADKVEASIQIERLIDDASRKVDEDQQKLAEAHAAKQAKANELKNIEAEQNALRRAKIASDLPVVNAEVEKSQRRLAEMRSEMAQLEATIQQGLEEKQRLSEEMEGLCQESVEQVYSLYEERIQEVAREDADTGKDTLLVSEPIEDDDQDGEPASPSPIVDNTAPDTISISRPQSSHSNSAPDITNDGVPDSLPNSAPDIHTGETEDDQGASVDIPDNSTQARGDVQSEMSDHALKTVLPDESSNAETESQLGISSDVDMKDSCTEDQNKLAPALISPTGKNLQKADPTRGVDSLSPEDGESDHYEPPEATQAATEAVPSTDSPPFSPAPPELGSEGAQTDLRPQISSPLEPANMAMTISSASNRHVLPPTEMIIKHGTGIGTSHRSYFTPYESPLKNFRAYRFHPAFEKEVAGGFKSLTYSNNIKYEQELCRYELAGGVCNDTSCESQHFKTMGLADDAILVELGNSAGYREEDKPRFVSGLRAVLQDLRTKKTKDFQVIAAEIAAFRARFLQDKSKVILLDG